jgi:hypothetical protein
MVGAGAVAALEAPADATRATASFAWPSVLLFVDVSSAPAVQAPARSIKSWPSLDTPLS